MEALVPIAEGVLPPLAVAELALDDIVLVELVELELEVLPDMLFRMLSHLLSG